jgi:biopolymer transport protein ExbD
MRRKKRRRSQGDVELNLAAMLDMAFQLLAFFILTFKPAPFEGQIALQMPDARPLAKVEAGKSAGSDVNDKTPLLGLETLTVTALSTPSGEIAGLRLGEGEPTPSLRVLEDQLAAAFGDPGTPFEQVVLHVGSKLKYEYLMQLMDVCTRIKLPSGERLQKLSFVELPDGG